MYSPAGIANIRVPDVIRDAEICWALARVWEETRDIRVPQYRSGYGFDLPTKRRPNPINPKQKPRPIWDAAISKILLEMNAGKSGGNGGSGKLSWRELWKLDRLNHLRQLLHREPHVCGKPYHYSASGLNISTVHQNERD